MFVDKVTIDVRAGNGGDGAVSFRHEKFIDRGGPDGGDGGKGGDVVLVASRNENTLAVFRYQKEVVAKPGVAGSKQRKRGRSAEDMLVKVPIGTVAVNEAGEVLADLTHDEERAVIAKGGRGGFGNAHFVSSRRQTPRFAEKGEPGEELSVVLELKMIADVGLVGMPNAGKSTLLSRISNAKPEIADYPFTTLTPNLGVVDVDDTSLLFADIPGLIEGAAEGKGLGHEFLRHVERTAVLLHLIDVYQEDIAGTYKIIVEELKKHDATLAKRPQIVVLTKIEGLDKTDLDTRIKELKTAAPRGTKVMAISSLSGQGLDELLYAIKDKVEKYRVIEAAKQAEEPDAGLPVLRLADNSDSWTIKKDGTTFHIRGEKIERFARRTDFENEEAIQRLRDIMRKVGIMHELVRQGIEVGNYIAIGSSEPFEY
jgi:GTP-binding protein